MKKCNTLVINTSGLMSAYRRYFYNAMVASESKLLELMRKELPLSHAGRNRWKSETSKRLKVVYREVADRYIESLVGVPFDLDEHLLVRALVISEGNNNTDRPLVTKPGQLTWHGKLRYKDISKATTKRRLPDGWNQKGNHFVENAVRQMKKHFEDILSEAYASMPNELFIGNLKVRGR